MSDSPLNYSSVDYDFVGLQVHASGEVWTRDQLRHPRGHDRAVRRRRRRRCRSRAPTAPAPVTACPGNRRWVQLVFDSFLLHGQQPEQHGRRARRHARRRPAPLRRRQPGPALERVRQARPGRGRGQQRRRRRRPGAELRLAVRQRGRRCGSGRSTADGDRSPTPSCSSGDYQARAVPVADTDPATPLADQVSLVPGTYEFVVRAPGLRPRPRRPGHASGPGRPATCGCRCGSTSPRPPTGADRHRRRHQPRQAHRRRRGDQLGLARQRRWPASRSRSTWPAARSRSAGSRSAPCCVRRSPPTRTARRRAGSPRCGSSGSWACDARGLVTCADAADFRSSTPARPTRSRRSRRGRGRRS